MALVVGGGLVAVTGVLAGLLSLGRSDAVAAAFLLAGALLMLALVIAGGVRGHRAARSAGLG